MVLALAGSPIVRCTFRGGSWFEDGEIKAPPSVGAHVVVRMREIAPSLC